MVIKLKRANSVIGKDIAFLKIALCSSEGILFLVSKVLTNIKALNIIKSDKAKSKIYKLKNKETKKMKLKGNEIKIEYTKETKKVTKRLKNNNKVRKIMKNRKK